MTEPNSSIAVRVPAVGMALEIIMASHNAVVETCGSVWFGIRGRVPSQPRWVKLDEQAKRGTLTNLFVVQVNSSGLNGFRAPILTISDRIPPKKLIPPYYAEFNLVETCGLWVEAKEFVRIEAEALNSIQVESTGTPLTTVLRKGRASVMIVY